MILLKAATNFPITAKYCLLSGEIFLCENKGKPKQLLVPNSFCCTLMSFVVSNYILFLLINLAGKK